MVKNVHDKGSLIVIWLLKKLYIYIIHKQI